MRKFKLLLTSVAILFAGLAAYAQDVSVKGLVTDEAGTPIPGVGVVVSGTATGVVTNIDGQYTISVPKDAVLSFSSLGYVEQLIPVAGKSVINVVLHASAEELEGTIVVAYGTASREALTGSVSTVAGSTLADAPVASVDKLLGGKVAGVSISTTSGQPGSTSQIRIRGTSSINASNAPLWVVDGIPVLSGSLAFVGNDGSSSALTNINPTDIESITVLKDAAAAAAYGSRAANGVILVTTKSGRSGKAQFTASAKFGVNWLQNDSGFRMMNAEELLQFNRDAAANAGRDPDDPTSPYYTYTSKALLNKKLYNVLGEFTRLGKTSEYEITGHGGTARSSYYTSFNYKDQNGVFYGVMFRQLQGRVNASYKLTDNLESSIRLNLAYNRQANVPMQSLYYANPIWAGMTAKPWDEINPTGDWVASLSWNSGENPRSSAIYDERYDDNYRVNATESLKWTPLKGLVFESKNSFEGVFGDSRVYFSPKAHAGGTANQLDTDNKIIVQLTTSNTASYSTTFGGYHNFHAVVGQEANSYRYHHTEAYSPEVDESMPYHNTADQTTTEIYYGESNEGMLSFFGIADYNYDNRYFLQASIREDGSSLFGSDNKWGTFWSASAAWNITNEKFFKSLNAPVSLLKLRLSYGVTGNNGISPYQAYGLYRTAIYNGLTGYLPSQLENTKLSWEKNNTWNVGFDFGLLDNRITGQVDVYERLTTDLLLTKQIPQTTGFSTIFSNVGSMKNSGVELELEAELVRTSDALWSIGGNVAFNRTEILDLGGDEYLGTSVRQVVGKSMYTYYLFDYYGVNPSNGEALWVTEDGTLTNQYSKARRYYAGSPEPKAVGGFNTNFTWKGLSFGAFFEFRYGNKVLIWNENHYLQDDGTDLSMNKFASATNYWKKPGDTGCNPKPVAGNSSSSNDWYIDRWIEDGSFLRVKDVTLSYQLPSKVLQKTFLKGARVYVSGLNLYCFNDVNYWDPEQGVRGITAGAYPITKSVMGGIELTF